jgi:translocation and assembly module TamA
MDIENTRSLTEKSFRAMLCGTGLLVSMAGWCAGATQAHAFELFGLKLFQSSETADAVIDPVSYSLVLDGADGDLLVALQNRSLLFQDQKKPVSGDLGLVIKARDDRDRLIAALYENALYGGVVSVTVDGKDLDSLPPNPVFSTSGPVPVAIHVKPGPVFTFGNIIFKGDAAGKNPSDYGLTAGAVAKSTLVISAGSNLVNNVKQQGRPLAKLKARTLVADHKSNTVEVTIDIEAGPFANVGDIGVTGTADVNPQFVESWSRLESGKPYSPEALKKAGERLRQLGVFSSVNITEGDGLAADGTVPLNIEVSEGKQRYFGLGAQISSIDGIGLQGYWGHRNLFGNAETLRIEGSVSRLGQTKDLKQLDYSTAVLFSKPGAFGPASRFNAKLAAKLEHPSSYKAATLNAAANASFEVTDRDTLTGGLDLAWSETEDAFGLNRYLTSSIPLSWARDASDDKQNPTTGYRASLNTAPSFESYSKTFFVNLEGNASFYQSLSADDGIILAGKLAGGSILTTGQLQNIPATRRFYAGGGGSVRGFGYQEISPRNVSDQATGGLSYVSGAVEARIKINDSFAVVPFVDAASVSARYVPDFSDIKVGAGVGIRYATPFGPIRLDVAIPLNPYSNSSRFGIYAGLGQAF